MAPKLPPLKEALPTHFDLFYDGQWYKPKDGSRVETISPGTGESITAIAEAKAADVDAAVQAAHKAFLTWKNTTVQERATYLRRAAAVLHQHAEELALVDAYNTGNPVAEMIMDAHTAGSSLEYFAGLVPMIRGETLPGTFRPDEYLHYTVREPLGVVGRIVASNHPLMFAGAKMGAPLAAGNTVVIKPPDQAPLAVLRMAELLADVFPPGVISVLPGSVECGKALAAHPLVKKVTLIGSVPTGKAIQRDAADQLKPTLLELGGKNCLIAYPDADVEKLAQAMMRGMNFTWAGQSCGSMSRVFLHESLHDKVLPRVVELVQEKCQPGDPTDINTTMGCMISKAAQDRVLGYVESGKAEGARIICGGGVPKTFKDARLEKGFFVEPTIFADVTPSMRIAREEIFGPVMSVFRWKDEDEVFEIANSTSYGLTASIFTNDILTAQKATRRIEAGYVWVNDVSKHFLNVPFGGFKESGMGKEECLDEMLSFTNNPETSVYPRVISSQFGRNEITQIEDDVVLKQGSSVWPNEEAAIKLVKAYAVDIPVPTVYHAIYNRDTAGAIGTGMLYMEFIPGESLESVWPSLSEGNRERICRETWGLIDKLRLSPRVEKETGVENHGEETQLFYCTADGTSNIIHPLLGGMHDQPPPLRDDETLRARIWERYVEYNGLSYPDGHRVKDTLPRSETAVFTHGDIHPGNILVNEDKEDGKSGQVRIVGLVDFESAGFFPDYWEYHR